MILNKLEGHLEAQIPEKLRQVRDFYFKQRKEAKNKV